MQSDVYDALKEKLGDAKIVIDGEERALLDQVSYWEEGVIKTREANKDLTRQREEWETEKRTLRSSLEEKASLIADLEKKAQESTLSKEDKEKLEKLKGGSLIEREAYQKLENTVNDLQKQLDEEKAAREQAAQEIKTAALNGEKQKLKNEIMSELQKYDIIGVAAENAYHDIEAKGMAKVSDGESGFTRTFTIVKDGKDLVSNLADMAKRYADDHKFLVRPSGHRGTENNHQNRVGGSAGNSRNYRSMIYNQNKT